VNDVLRPLIGSHPAVLDWVVLRRSRSDGTPASIAYVVPRTPITGPELAAWLRERAGENAPDAVVTISALPLTTDGDLDRSALEDLPVLEPDTAAQLAQRVTQAVGAPARGRIARRSLTPPPAYHVSDVLDAAAAPPADATAGPVPAREFAERPDAARPLAIAHGAALRPDPGRPRTLLETLARAAKDSPAHGITYIGRDGDVQVQRYPELLADAARIAAGLGAIGVRAGDRVLFQFDRNHDFIPAFWGCVVGGFIPVPFAVPPSYADPGSAAVQRLTTAWTMLHEPVIVTGDRLADDLAALGSDRPAWRVQRIGALRAATADGIFHQPDIDEPALMMLTSGSTGTPKAVVLSHANLVARSAASQQMHGFTANEVTLNWMPLDHVAGIIYFHLRDVFLGCEQVHAQTDLVLQNPLTWLDLIERWQATITFAPNFAFGLVVDAADVVAKRQWNLSSLRYALNGAEAIVPRTARRFLSILAPHQLRPAVMHPAWGMSETSSGVVYSRRFSLATTSDDDPFAEVGEPMPGMSLRIVDDTNTVVEESTIGRLQVRGTTVMGGYFERPDLNASVFTPDGWFDTGDLATIRNGQLTITGREKDDIVVNSVKYYSHEIEAIVDELPCAVRSYTAACGVRPPGQNTEALAVFFVPTHGDAPSVAAALGEVRRAVARRSGLAPGFVVPVTPSDIPKTGIGKIQRAQVRERFERGGFADQLRNVDLLTGTARTIPNWFFRHEWTRSALPAASAAPRLVLALVNEAAQAEALGRALTGCAVIHVTAGSHYAAEGPDRFTVRADSRDDFAQMFAALAAARRSPEVIVHLWACAPQHAQNRPTLEHELRVGPLSVLAIYAALQAAPLNPAPRVVVITAHAHAVTPSEAVVPMRATTHALLRTAADESRAFAAASIDIATDSVDLELPWLAAEIDRSGPWREVAYRAGQRYIRSLRRIDLAELPHRPLPFARGGFYVVSGGLGGLSVGLAEFLLHQHDARLLLLGRTPLARSTDAALDPDAARRFARRRRDLERLENCGGAVRYETVDVADAEAVAAAVARAQADWNRPVDGVIHLAGVYQDRLLERETEETLTATLRAKTLGALALFAVVRDVPGALFLAFSSVNGTFGGVGAGAYAAANAFLDAFTSEALGAGLRAHTIGWTQWDETGMSEGFALKDVARAKGYLSIAPIQGWNSLQAALARTTGHVLVGLDATNVNISRELVDACEALDTVIVDVPDASRAKQPLTLTDRFGAPVVAMVVSSTGEQPTRVGATRGELSGLERTIARCWAQALQLDDPDPLANFFDLGGSSLLMAQVNRALREHAGLELGMTEMFAYPSIRALAHHIEGRSDADAAPRAAANRGRQAREQALRRRRAEVRPD